MRAAVVNAFVKDGRGGNPAGVVLDAGRVGARRRQQIAAQLALSETVFVETLAERAFKLRYFTPTTELALCGHATIATFGHLLAERRLSPGAATIDTKAGTLAVEVMPDGLVMMDQNRPVFGPRVSPEKVSPALGGAPVLDARVVSTGLPDLLAEVPDAETLLALKPDLAAIKRLTASVGATSLHVFARGTGAVAARCRDFAPGVGIDEESATGTASGALACHLAERGLSAAELVFVQGESMGRASEILARVETRNRAIARVSVGGRAALERFVEL